MTELVGTVIEAGDIPDHTGECAPRLLIEVDREQLKRLTRNPLGQVRIIYEPMFKPVMLPGLCPEGGEND